jgi:hypothetical protein
MRYGIRAAVMLLIALALCGNASAQVLGTIAGSVKDASGAVLPGVTVEVSSPALIEKVRTTTTDGSGLYRIVNLPPGAYTVTFTLTGFNTTRRESVNVSPNFTASIDGEMRVGNLQETVTVTGESPVVDVQSAAATRSITAEVFKEIPSSGSWVQMASLVPAIRATVQDVGGVAGDATGASVSAHGGRAQDGVSMIDGLRIGNMYLSSNVTNMSLSPLLADQVDIQLSGQMAETGTNGVIMNMVPRAGGNRFSGSALANVSHPNLQSSNVTARLQARQLQGASTTLKKLYDLNAGVGGPIKRDKLWFYGTSRYYTNEFYVASTFYPLDATVLRREDDLSRQAYGGTYTYDNNGRLTWAISDKQKVSGWYAYQYKVDPHWAFNSLLSPEAARVTVWHTQLSTTKYTYTATNRLLFEAGIAAGASPDTIRVDENQVGRCPEQGSLAPRCIAIVEQGGAIAKQATYRAPTGFDFDDRLPSQSYNVSASYVTGAHNAKFGMELQQGHFWRGDNNDSTGGIWYRTRDFVPNLVTIQAPLYGYQNNLNYNLGLFLQDRWTIDRLTLSGGLRVDLLNESTEPVTAAAHRWTPNRNQPYAAVKNVPNWKDVNPRVSAAYDLFGNGRTALKASASRSVEQDSIRYAAANNPANTLVTSVSRVWTDTTFGPADSRTNNFVPDCDLLNPLANGECLGWQDLAFGSDRPGTSYDPAILNGWGERPWNWEFSASIQQEIVPRLSATFGYFRRVAGNFFVNDNEALAATDFTGYSVVAPTTDARLPTAGQTISGFVDQNRAVASRVVVKNAEQFGKQLDHWDGFDLTVDARLRSGLFVQGGVSVGTAMTDNCDIVDDLPELLGGSSIDYCHQETPLQGQYKALASYTLPWYGVRVSGTFQSLPGPVVAANNAYVGTATSLGRAFGLGGNSTVNLIKPGTLYGDRLNQFDLRFTKILRVPSGNLDLNVDLYNAFNSDAVLAQNNTFGAATWWRPTNVVQPRFVKFYARWDF